MSQTPSPEGHTRSEHGQNEHGHNGHSHHGHTVAAWTLSIIVMVASVVSSIGVILANEFVFWAGVVLIGVGLIAGKVLASLGFGKKS
jgi:hypothetical protein